MQLNAPFFLALLGLIDSLLVESMAYGANGFICAEQSSCAVVLNSESSHFWGLPTALYGALFYSVIAGFMAVLYVRDWRTSRQVSILVDVTLITGLALHGYLFAEQMWIQSFCPYCVIATILTLAIYLSYPRYRCGFASSGKFHVALFTSMVGLIAAGYIVVDGERNAWKSWFDTVAQAIDTKGAHYSGPLNRRVTIHLFGDFNCIHCSTLAAEVGKLMKAFPEVGTYFFPVGWTGSPRSRYSAIVFKVVASQTDPQGFQDALFALKGDSDPHTIGKLALRFGVSINQNEFPSAKKEVDQVLTCAKNLRIKALPAVYIQGRRVAKPNSATLKSIISELHRGDDNVVQ